MEASHESDQCFNLFHQQQEPTMSFSMKNTSKKRKRWTKIFPLQSFANPRCPISPSGPFRENVQLFLQEAGELEDYTVMGNSHWCTFLTHEKKNLMVPFYTLEEVYNTSHPFCDHCRCVGWSEHLVSKRRYHFIIPMDDGWHKPLNEEALDDQSHLLHGVIHCNGYGHLVCLNGIEGGSKFLSGREIMDLWDRICTNLRARYIAVEDASRKRSMDLRLIHGVAYGHSWFGRWGYGVCRGSFGVAEQNYNEAIETLGSLVLDDIVRDLSKTKYHKDVKQMIRFYRDMSETHIITIRELLRFMLTVKSRQSVSKMTATCSSPNAVSDTDSARYKKFSTAVADMDSRWPIRRLEFAAQVIVEALANDRAGNPGSSGMTRKYVREVARLRIGDTGLLDYVLNSLNNVIVGNYVVRSVVNSSSRILEYTIDEVRQGLQTPKMEHGVVTIADEPQVNSSTSSVVNDVYSDVVYLYKNVLLGYPDSEAVELAVQTILDCRHFVKEWKLRDEMEFNFVENKSDLNGPSCGEIVTVPLYATVRDLKQTAEATLRDTYCIAERLIVTDIKELMEDEEVSFGQIESGVKLSVRGIGIDLCTPLPGRIESRCLLSSMVDNRPCEGGRSKELPDINPKIIVSFDNEMMVTTTEPSFCSVGIFGFPNPDEPINIGSHYPIWEATLNIVVKGLCFLIGRDYFQVINPYLDLCSARERAPRFRNMKVTVGYDASRGLYKMLGLRRERLGTRRFIFDVGLARQWRTNEGGSFVPVHILEGHWFSYPVTQICSPSSIVYFLTRRASMPFEDEILSFNFDTEQFSFLPLPPAAASANNRVLCIVENRLSISYSIQDNFRLLRWVNGTWESVFTININLLHERVRFLPIHSHGNKVLVAFIPEQLEMLEVGEYGTGVLVDTETGAVDFVESDFNVNWFSAKFYVQSREELPV